MSATVQRPRREFHLPAIRTALSPRLWSLVAASRLVVLVAGALSALWSVRASGWQAFDPTLSTRHLGPVGNLLAASADRWDSIHYIQIAQHGYTTTANAAFYPLYPLLMRLLAPLTAGSYLIAGALISLVSFVVALSLLHELTVEELGVEAGRATVLLLAFAPLSFFFTAVYTESLFLAVSVGAFYAARRERWALAAILAAAATATRVPGVLVIIGVACVWWGSETRPRRALAWLALATLPLLAFSLYLDTHGYGLLASIRSESQYGRSMGGPILTVYRAIHDAVFWSYRALRGWPMPSGIGSPMPVPIYNLVELLILGIALVTLVDVWRRLARPYAVYATLALIVCLWSALPIETLKSFDRYMLTLFPLWMVAGRWASRRGVVPLLLGVEAVALVFYTHQFAGWWFVA